MLGRRWEALELALDEAQGGVTGLPLQAFVLW